MSVKTEDIQTFIDQAKTALAVSDFKRAKELYHEAEQLNNSSNAIDSNAQALNQAKICNGLSHLSWQTGAYDEAMKYAEQAIATAQKAGAPDMQAEAIRNMGITYVHRGNYKKALEYFQKALNINQEIGNKQGVAGSLGNIGMVYSSLGELSLALTYFQKALVTQEDVGNRLGIATNMGNMGRIYDDLADKPKALEYYQKALAISEEIGNKEGIAIWLSNIGGVYSHLLEDQTALEYYQKALTINKEIGKKVGVSNCMGNIGKVYLAMADYPKALEYLSPAVEMDRASNNIRQLCYWLLALGRVYYKKNPPDYVSAEKTLQEALAASHSQKLRKEESQVLQSIAELYRTQERWQEADEHFQKFHELFAEIQSEEARKQSLNIDNLRQLENAERDRQVKLARFQEQEKILHNILPSQIAERILEGEKQIADYCENVSVFFSDIVGFTNLSQNISPNELVTMLNEIFSEFDRIARKNGLEKIKTIGDAYMAVAGVPLPQENHAERAALFAIEVMQFMSEYRARTGNDLRIRVGLHCGHAVAGVIGENKFAFDLWGDAVNTASRMESHGVENKIQVSDDFRKAAGDKFQFEERGEIEVKGKGRMKTWFLQPA